MPTIKMTARNIPTIPLPASGQVDYWDADTPGFGLRVSKAGRKSWVVMYRHGNVKRRLTVGTYPALSLADARDKAGIALRSIQYDGADPAAEKKADRAAETFEELARDYIERHAKRNKRSWRKDLLILEKDVLPRFGKWKAKDIKRREIIALLDSIVERGAPIQANRTLAVIRKLFNWAIGRDLIEESPCYRIPTPSSENSSDRVLSENEIRAAWAAFEQEQPLTAATFKIRLLTAQRGIEVLSMNWNTIENGWWTIPASIAKNGIAHRVPLSKQVLEILEEVKPLGNGSQWVFPGTNNDNHRVAVHKAHDRIREHSKIDFVPHDLRRTAASHMTSMGINRLVVKKILNHVEDEITAVYDRHSYDHEKGHALEAWGNQLNKILNKETTSNIVTFKAV